MDTVVALQVRDASIKERIVTAIRVAFAFVPLVFLATRVDFHAIGRAIGVVGASHASLAVALQVLGVVFGAVRWRILLRSFGATDERLLRLGTLVRHCFVGLYFGMIPTGLVGEIVRARRTRSSVPVAADAYVVMFVDRACAAIGLLTVSLVALADSTLARANASIVASLRVFVGTGLVLSIVALSLPFVLGRSDRVRTAIAQVPRIGPLLGRLTPPKDARSVAIGLALSIFVEGSFVAAILATVLPFAPEESVRSVLLSAPVILLLTFLPLTPGALGQRELAFVALLPPFGITAAEAIAASLVTLFVSFLLAAVGGAVVLVERARAGEATTNVDPS